MVTDTVGDYLTRIRNAQARKKNEVLVPSSKMLVAISKVLKQEGFIEEFEEDSSNEVQKTLKVKLRYLDNKPVIRKLMRISKPGVRVYSGYRNIPKVKSGIGITILTTPRGVMSGEQARKEKVGGELLCKIW